jgi:redox-sensitive bicupin YhaK (pirin superfamily)
MTSMTTTPPSAIRRAGDRGYADHGWLRSFHTFSFADYYDPKNMGFRTLRVINEDRVAPGRGFGTHSHRDMEILSYVLAGELAHKDSMGSVGVIRPGDVQRMSAGTGVSHSEFNNSADEAVHFLQIWILPERPGITPGYEQKHFPVADRRGQLRLIASQGGRDGSVAIHQDADVRAALLGPGEQVSHHLASGRAAWLHVARGSVKVGGETLAAGDAASFQTPGAIEISAGSDDSELLLFDLA